LVSIWNYNFTC